MIQTLISLMTRKEYKVSVFYDWEEKQKKVPPMVPAEAFNLSLLLRPFHLQNDYTI